MRRRLLGEKGKGVGATTVVLFHDCAKNSFVLNKFHSLPAPQFRTTLLPLSRVIYWHITGNIIDLFGAQKHDNETPVIC